MGKIIKENLAFYLQNFYFYDYVFFIGLFFLFLIIVGVVALNRHSAVLSLMTLFFGLLVLIFSGVFGYDILDKNIRPRKITIVQNQQLNFSNNIVVAFKIEPAYKICKINIKMLKKSDGYLEKIKSGLHPLANISFVVKNSDFVKKVIPNTKMKNYDLLINTNCF